MTKLGSKRSSKDSVSSSIQASNEQLWTDYTMSYDWNDKVRLEQFTPQWFDEIDKRFVHGARLFAHSLTPFDNIIPFENLHGKRVLEIGCGMGYHSELLVRSGAVLTAIDLSDTSVDATRQRFSQRDLTGTILKMDAVNLDFPDQSFDFVWSWGVIHHSAETGRIIQEISRVLCKGGEARIMVYNLNGMSAYVTLAMNYLAGFWKGLTLDECLWKHTDGFMARYYTSDMLCDFMRVFFKHVSSATYGQDVDAVPLPRKLRYPLMRLMSQDRIAKLANERGGFLFVIAEK
jgi:2-polyprenyl-3-methyl-5-hydroxy-6-metoxy-1,4-benzoquinol methylase